MFKNILKVSMGIVSFVLLSILSASNVNAGSRCTSSVSLNLNSTYSEEYALNDTCRDFYINLNNYNSYVNNIRFDAHDFGSEYDMDIYFKASNGGYYLKHRGIDISTQNRSECGVRNNEPDYNENSCFKYYGYNINEYTNNIVLRVYTKPGKTVRNYEYAYIKNIRIEGSSHSYPTYTPTPYPTYHGQPNLLVEDIRFSPEKPTQDQNVDIDVEIRNKNGNREARGFYVRMYRNNREIANTYYNETLYSGQGFTWRVNNMYLENGNNTIKVVVDSENNVYESNENDNTRTEDIYKYYIQQPTYPQYPGNVLGQNVNIYINGNCNNVIIFSDIYGNRYYGPIYAAACHGITQGYSDNTYRPSSYITRAEFVSMLARSFPEAFNNYGNCSYFRDVDYNNVHGYNISRATCAKLLKGYSDNTFRPNNYVSYGEAASILYNLLNKYGYSYQDSNLSYHPNFMNPASPHYYSVYYLANMNPYSAYPAYDYYNSNSMRDGNYAERGWIANLIVSSRKYVY